MQIPIQYKCDVCDKIKEPHETGWTTILVAINANLDRPTLQIFPWAEGDGYQHACSETCLLQEIRSFHTKVVSEIYSKRSQAEAS